MTSWTIWVCPICGGLPEHLGDGRQGCGRHIPTTYFQHGGVSRPGDKSDPFVPVEVVRKEAA